jgi:hypothetical protein
MTMIQSFEHATVELWPAQLTIDDQQMLLITQISREAILL